MEKLLRIGQESGDDLLTIAGHEGIAMAHLCSGHFRRCLDHAERGIALYEPGRHRFHKEGFVEEVGVTCFGWASWALWHLGRPDRSCEMATRAVEIAGHTGHVYTQAWIRAMAGMSAVMRGDCDHAREFGRSAAEIGEAQGLPLPDGVGRLAAAFADGLSGDHGAVERATEALMRTASTNQQAAAPWVLGKTAEIQLAVDCADDALSTVSAALAIADQTGQRLSDAELHRLRGECCLHLEGHTEDEVEAAFRRGIEIAQEQDAKAFELRAVMSLARLWQTQGKRDEARELLKPVYDSFTEGFDTQDLKDAKALLEELA
jgi:hypothetical protein